MENADLTRELNMAGTPNQINKMTEDPDDTISPEAGVRAAEVAAVPSGPSVVVKSASQSVPDMVVDCLPEWTVLDLKRFLGSEHSLKPAIKEQRLIYSGHLMTDDSLLTSLLKHSSSAEGRFVLHLVCAPSRIPKPDGTSSLASHNSLSAAPSANNSSSNSVASSSTSGLRHRTGAPQPASEGWAHSMQGGTELPTVDVRAQAEAYKQYYESYMRSYMTYLQSAGVAVNPADPSLMAAWRQQLLALPEQIPAAAPASLAADVADQQQQQPREVQPVQPPQLNADELQIADEDAVPHDWLDSLYIFVRFGILVFFVYFYSSFYRFFIIITVGVLIYLYRVGWFRTIALPVEEARPRDAQQQQQQQQQPQAQEPPQQREPPPAPAQPAARNPAEHTNTSAGGSSPAPPNADRAAASTSFSDGAGSSSDLADATASLPVSALSSTSSSPSPAASNTEDVTTCLADSITEREPGSSGRQSNAEAESVREAQGELNNDPPLAPSPRAAANILPDSAAQDGATPPPPGASFFTLSWTFITALLTSLVPDQHQIL